MTGEDRRRRPARADTDRDEDALLSGRLDPADVPPGLRGVAEALAAARGPAGADELRGEDQIVRAMASRARQNRQEGARVRAARSVRKTAAVVLVGGLAALGSASVAAANGSLPGPTQNFVAHVASHFHVSFPSRSTHPKVLVPAPGAPGPGRTVPAKTTSTVPSSSTSSTTMAPVAKPGVLSTSSIPGLTISPTTQFGHSLGSGPPPPTSPTTVRVSPTRTIPNPTVPKSSPTVPPGEPPTSLPG